jgi:hypothetical protein
MVTPRRHTPDHPAYACRLVLATIPALLQWAGWLWRLAWPAKNRWNSASGLWLRTLARSNIRASQQGANE